MFRFVNLFILFVFATLFHWLCLIALSPFEITLESMFLVSLIVASLLPEKYGYTFAFFSGLFVDFFGIQLFGAHAFVFVLLVFLFYNLKNKIDFKTISSQIIITASLTIVEILLFGFIFKIGTGTFFWLGFKNIFWGTWLCSILMPAIYRFIERFLIFNVLKKLDEK